LSPALFSTGIDSPVTIDSSKDEYPSFMTPSTGTFSPGLTMTISPISTSSTGISTSPPFLRILAVFAWSPISFLIASEVCPFALASNSLPSRIRTTMVAAVS
jgi:hypothetical protein